MRYSLRNNKKGITLVESVLALAILVLIAVAVFSLFTAANSFIAGSGGETAAYAESVQKMDFLIAAVSDSGALCSDPITGELSVKQVKEALSDTGLYDAEISARVSLYDPSLPQQPENIRGWYLTLTYQGMTLQGFASYGREGVSS